MCILKKILNKNYREAKKHNFEKEELGIYLQSKNLYKQNINLQKKKSKTTNKKFR